MTIAGFPVLVGESLSIRRLRAMIAKVAPTSLPVLIAGATGVGKEVVASLIHLQSGRRGPLVAFNVCAISDSMFEDALFGHVRGAFTGAAREVRGYLAEAHGGTAFLDEISGLPLSLQAKLLRAIETRRFRPIGAHHDAFSDFRLLAATNEDLDALIAAGCFRADLAHRLGALSLRVPALADRVDDIPLLVSHFLARFESVSPGQVTIDAPAVRRMQEYHWPGNVRELKHIVEAAAACSDAGVVTSELIDVLLSRKADIAPVPDDADERHELRILLERCDWNTALAAAELGVDRSTVYRRMSRVALRVPSKTTRRRTLAAIHADERRPDEARLRAVP